RGRGCCANARWRHEPCLRTEHRASSHFQRAPAQGDTTLRSKIRVKTSTLVLAHTLLNSGLEQETRMKRLASWLCILALLAPFGSGSDVDLEAPAGNTRSAPRAPIGDGETSGGSAHAESDSKGPSAMGASAPSIASAPSASPAAAAGTGTAS